jgi:hypothetical protein
VQSDCNFNEVQNYIFKFFTQPFSIQMPLSTLLCAMFSFVNYTRQNYLCIFPTGWQHAHVTDNFPELHTDILGEKNLKAIHSCCAFSTIRSTIYLVSTQQFCMVNCCVWSEDIVLLIMVKKEFTRIAVCILLNVMWYQNTLFAMKGIQNNQTEP